MIRVLIVEDVDEMREMLRALIEGVSGLSVSGTAANGWDARVEVDRRRPDVVLLDEILPGESSLDLLQDWVGQGVPVVLMTGVEDPKHALPAGAQGRVIKPDWRTLDRAAPEIERLIRAAASGAAGASRK